MLEPEEIEAFWDGGTALVLGFAGVNFSPRLRLEIGVWAAKNDAAGDLLDYFRPVAGMRFRYLTLPPGINQLRLGFCEGPGISWMTLDLHADEATVSATDYSRNLTFIRMANPREQLDLQTQRLPSNNDLENFVDRLASGERLLWAAAQLRHDDSEKKRIAISSTRLLWPRRMSRFVIEVARHAPAPKPEPASKPPNYAVLEKAQAEAARRVAPRLRIRQLAGNRPGTRPYDGVCVFYLMQQRRFFQSVATRDAERTLEALSSCDIRNAYDRVGGDPTAVEQLLPLVPDRATGPVGFDLASAVGAFDRGEIYRAPGAIALRAGGRGASDDAVDIEFPTAALGDEVGVFLSHNGTISLSVLPTDPGGAARIRIFRLGKTGLTAQEVTEDDPILLELADWVIPFGTTRARGATDPTAHGHSRPAVELLQSRMGDPVLVDGVDLAAVLASPLGPLATLSFADMVATSPRDSQDLIERVGGLAAFLKDAASVSSLVFTPHLAGSAMVEALMDPELSLAEPALPRRLAAGLGAADLVPATLIATEQLQAIRILRDQDLVQRLIALRVALDNAKSGMQRTADRVVGALEHDDVVRDAADSYHDRGMPSQAQALIGYLNTRDLGAWIALQDAAALVDLIDDVERFREFQTRNRKTLRRDRQSGGSIAQLRANVAEAIERLKGTGQSEQVANFQQIPLDQMDRPLLESLYAEVEGLLDRPADMQLEQSIVATLERWADLPQFAESVRQQHRGDAAQDHKGRSLVEDIVNRLRLSVPAPNRGPFNAEAEELKQAIRKALLEGGRMTKEREELGDDLRGYGYILLFHNARRAMDELLVATARDPALVNSRGRLMRRLVAWPRDARQTWREALDLASKVDEDLEAKIQPPDL
jgi:hypothetical protein